MSPNWGQTLVPWRVLCGRVVLFSEVTNVLSLWGSGTEVVLRILTDVDDRYRGPWPSIVWLDMELPRTLSLRCPPGCVLSVWVRILATALSAGRRAV